MHDNNEKLKDFLAAAMSWRDEPNYCQTAFGFALDAHASQMIYVARFPPEYLEQFFIWIHNSKVV